MKVFINVQTFIDHIKRLSSNPKGQPDAFMLVYILTQPLIKCTIINTTKP